MAPDNRYTSGRRLVLSILFLCAVCLQITSECDQTFVSRPGGPMNGTFRAPEFENPRGLSRNCVYTFLAGAGQRVQITFVTFNLRGRPPDGAAVGDLPACVHEYLDVYAEVLQPAAAQLVNTPFGGRYCGPIRPRTRVSLYRALALSYHSDKNSSTADIFQGIYQFINDSEYDSIFSEQNTHNRSE
ncbi:unnamed protein product [Phaedon cochleariae]|uniref:CUB domain-containing protein n=1 Tax=Phaedon cochleariae TaxID=80249 RepID=A0A9P0DRS3_PHACE|nr:unnamed protein product [Phaedon cochleariae]